MINILKNSRFHRIFFIISIMLLVYGFQIDLSKANKLKDYIAIGLSFGASFLGIVFVILEVEARISMFIIGIISSLFSIVYLYFYSPLIWDFSISIGYLVLNIYGLYYWQNLSKTHTNSIQHLTLKNIIKLTIISILGISLLSYIGTTWGRYSSITQSITDAATTVLSLIGQYLLAKKYIEVWYIWILVNGLSIPLYLSISSYIYAMVYFSYLAISFYGLFSWKKVQGK